MPTFVRNSASGDRAPEFLLQEHPPFRNIRTLRDHVVHGGADANIHCDGHQFNLWLVSSKGWITREPLLPLLHERAGRITPGHEKIGLALLKRLGQDGRCDPSHETLAADSGKDVSTVQRALKRFHACGLVSWVRRITRVGQRVSQTSNAYILTVGNPPNFPANRCEWQSAGQTRLDIFPTAPVATPADVRAAQAALARRRAAVEGRFASLFSRPASIPACVI
jgi:hypothetical protein